MKNIYKTKLLRICSSVDALVDDEGSMSEYARAITENDEEAVVCLYKYMMDVYENEKDSKDITQAILSLREILISYLGYKRLTELCTYKENIITNSSLDELMKELNALVGLNNVKDMINNLICYYKIQKLRRDRGFSSEKNTMHLAFMGNPGTGKTTVARIIGQIYKHIGILSKGHFIEAGRTDLIAGYQGQTALKVKKLIEKAIGGVLFIDEAYSITENENGDAYGRECLTELTKALEDYREDLVVIVAGYTEPMKTFFGSNPGLKSRFNTFIYFDDYNSEELFEIFESICLKNNYIAEETLKNEVKNYFDSIVNKKPLNFSNGRFVRNVFENIVMNHSKRLSEILQPTDDELNLLKAIDFSVDKKIVFGYDS